MRCFVFLCALMFSACASPAGSLMTAEDAEIQRMAIQTSLDHALALHAQGYTHDAKKQWDQAKTAYNNQLRAGIAFHDSPKEALRISVLFGQIAHELSSTKGAPEGRIAELTREFDLSVQHIPSATPEPVILAHQSPSEAGEVQQTAQLQTETIPSIGK